MIAAVTIVMAAAAFLYSINQKPIYAASTTILLRSSNGASQYAGLAGMLGANISSGGVGNAGDLTELLKSRVVAAKVLDDLQLTKRIKGWNDPTVKRHSLASAVSGMLKPPKTSGNLVELKVETDDAQLAADVANDFVNALAYYWNELNFTQAQKKLKYITAELPRVESDLKTVENKLKLAPAAGGILASGTGSLQRDFEIYNSVYVMLKKELESTKLEAAKEIPPFSMVDQAEKPLSKSKPKTGLNVMIGLVLGLFSGVFIAFFQEYWEKTSQRLQTKNLTQIDRT
jgi:uncharacterized protein involved in exopolysaccharide biosynthesis